MPIFVVCCSFDETDDCTGIETTKSAVSRSVEEVDLSFDAVKAFLEQEGYAASTLTEYEDYFLIDSDMGFSKEDLAKAMSEPDSRAVCSTLLDKKYYRMELGLCYGSNDAYTAFLAAIDEWNSVRCCVHFATSWIPSPCSTSRLDVEVVALDDPPFLGGTQLKDLMYVSMPLKSRPHGAIYINTAHPNWKNINLDQKVYMFLHAFGHLVGLQHQEFFSEHYPGTEYDPNTIMQSESGLSSNIFLWQGLTAKDKTALRTIYPMTTESYEIACTPGLSENEPNRMKIGQEYTLKAYYEHPWVFEPDYDYELIAEEGVVSRIPSLEPCKFVFNKAGSCRVQVSVRDAFWETWPHIAYSFEVTYRAYAESPTFICPKTVKLNEYNTFKIDFDNPDYQDATYSYKIQESVFDGNTAKSATIVEDGKGGAKIRFNDYGDYLVTATAKCGDKTWTFKYRFAKFYRPQYNVKSVVVEGDPDAPLPADCKEFIDWNQVTVSFPQAMEHRTFCRLHDEIRLQSWTEPIMIAYRTVSDTVTSKTLSAGDKPTFVLDPQPEYISSRVLEDYPAGTVWVFPYAWVEYPEDFCGEVE